METSLLGLLLALSDALGLAGPTVARHQMRVAYVAWRLGQAAGLPVARLEQLFYAALLHDIGILAGPDPAFAHEQAPRAPAAHSLRGSLLLAALPWLEGAVAMVRHHHRPWSTAAREDADGEWLFEAQLLALVDRLDRSLKPDLHVLQQARRVTDEVAAGSGELFHPEAVAVFQALAGCEDFWLEMTSPCLDTLLRSQGPARHVRIDLAELGAIAEAFSFVVDFRSHFTATHSAGVAAAATALARMSGFGAADSAEMGVAGHLHDLGKLAIPAAVLEKPGALDASEFALMRAHPWYAWRVLRPLDGFARIAGWAAFHHERLDGNGYPFHHAGPALDQGARIMAVADVMTALVEDRPYRAGMRREEVTGILDSLAQRGIVDPAVVRLALDNYGELAAHLRYRQDSVRRLYEEQAALVQMVAGG
jgi:HD-GYP domain-containing protein (c-di-GMP phosphodiesterase class II)